MATLILDGTRHRLSELTGQGSSWTVAVGKKEVVVRILREISTEPLSLLVQSGSRVFRVSARRLEAQDSYAVEINGNPLVVELEDDTSLSLRSRAKAVEGAVTVRSPMAGKIVAVKTSVGARIEEGQPLIMLEAMKMENVIAAPKSGTVKEVYVQTGALAKPGERLVLIE